VSDDDFICREVVRPVSRRKILMRHVLRKEALTAFAEWKNKATRFGIEHCKLATLATQHSANA
jgi:hypothetical protein